LFLSRKIVRRKKRKLFTILFIKQQKPENIFLNKLINHLIRKKERELKKIDNLYFNFNF
jgi:hypothetical protein